MEVQVSYINEEISYCNDQHKIKELIIKKEFYINTFDSMLRTNTFLMMYSYLEEFLYHVRKWFAKNQDIKYSGSLERFKEVVRNILNVDLGKDREWNLLLDYEKVRDCLLHANGRVSIARKKDDLEDLIKNSHGYLRNKNDRIELSGEYLNSVSDTIDGLIKRVEKIAMVDT
jgi:hypothetical protein